MVVASPKNVDSQHRSYYRLFYRHPGRHTSNDNGVQVRTGLVIRSQDFQFQPCPAALYGDSTSAKSVGQQLLEFPMCRSRPNTPVRGAFADVTEYRMCTIVRFSRSVVEAMNWAASGSNPRPVRGNSYRRFFASPRASLLSAGGPTSREVEIILAVGSPLSGLSHRSAFLKALATAS